MNNYPVVLASPENNTVRHSDELENEFEKDLDLLLLNNRYRRPPPPKKPFYAEFPSYKKYLDRVKNVCIHIHFCKYFKCNFLMQSYINEKKIN